MEYRALKSFSGLVSMRRGEVKKIKDKEIVKDLLRAGYIEPLERKKKTS
jgi:hypothetical protein